MKLVKNEPSIGQMRQEYNSMIGKCEGKRKKKAKTLKLKKECSMDGRYEMLKQNVS